MTRGFIRTVLIAAAAALVVGLSAGCERNFVTVTARTNLSSFLSDLVSQAFDQAVFPNGG